MTILKKFRLLLTYPNRPGEQIEFTPYELNMLNALEATAKCRVSEGELVEISSKHWTFKWSHSFGTATMDLTMMEENIEYGGKSVAVRKLPPPRFK